MTIGKDEKVGPNNSLYSDTKKLKSFWPKKINTELQLKDTKSAIKSKLIKLLTQVLNSWQH